MWAGPAQLTGPAPGTFSWADLGPTYPSSSFLGQAGPKWIGPSPHGYWPNPTIMLINHAACKNEFYMQQPRQ